MTATDERGQVQTKHQTNKAHKQTATPQLYAKKMDIKSANGAIAMSTNKN